MMDFDLIFYNAGGITIQTERGGVYEYNNIIKCAGDVAILLLGGTDDDWEGNQPERHLTYNHNDEQRGAYRWLSRADIEFHLVHRTAMRSTHGTVAKFIDTLSVIRSPAPTPKEFEQMMRAATELDDFEGPHVEMDRIMAETLSKLGYHAGIAIFESEPKYYA